MTARLNVRGSQEAYRRACALIPGGVNSPVRAFKGVGGTPIFIERAMGARLYDVDDNEYIDYVGSWGPAIVGHAHPEVVKAVSEAAAKGLSYGAPTRAETELAETIKRHVPSMEKVRLVSSGTEACMSALRLARAFTGRDKIVKFTGCYHGHADMLLVKAGSGALTLGLPDSPGVPQDATRHTLVAQYNDVDGLAKLFAENDGQIAAVILEPIIGNSGFIRPTRAFLDALRELTTKAKALLIFDEVMTGFRVGMGGVQGLTGIRPDLTTLGKVIGGGLPVAAYGGRADVMAMVAPDGPMYQAGTLSGNPLAVAAGLKTLEILERPESFPKLTALMRQLVNGLKELASSRRIPFMADGEGGMFGFFFHGGPVASHEDAKGADLERFKRFFHAMLARGIYLAPSAFEAGFVSLAHEPADGEATLAAAEAAFAEIG